jgi:hypothetical protein
LSKPPFCFPIPMKPDWILSLGFVSAPQMLEGKMKGAAAAIPAVDLINVLRETFRFVFMMVARLYGLNTRRPQAGYHSFAHSGMAPLPCPVYR